MRLHYFRVISVFLLVVFAKPAFASLDLLAEIGIHEGGDDIIPTVFFTDGTSRVMQAGEFLSLGIGVAWDLGDILEGRLFAGWKGDEVAAVDGNVKLNRWTSNFMLMIKSGNLRIGGGAAYHWDVKLEGGGKGTFLTADFDDAVGLVAEIDYYFTEGAYIGIQYLDIEYDRLPTMGNSAHTFDASSIGLVIGGRW